MRAHLSILAPTLTRGMSVTLAPGQELTVGSSRWADLKLEDRALSGRHLQISMISGECWLRDLKSSAGTFVNGIRVIATEICDGDIIHSGETSISVTLLRETSSVDPANLVREEFQLSRETLDHCSVDALPNGLIRLSSDRVTANSIAMDCLRFGVGTLASNPQIPGSNPTTKWVVPISKGINWLRISQENAEQYFSDEWGQGYSTWFVGRATPNSIAWLATQFDTISRLTFARGTITEWSSAANETLFDKFLAVMVKDPSPPMGWSLFFRPSEDAVPLESVFVDSKPIKKGRMSSVA